MRLIVIGNGFDKHFGLKTDPDYFKYLLSQQHIYSEIDNALGMFEAYGVTWGEYEESLSDLDLEYIEESNLQYPNYLADHEYERDDTILNIKMYLDSINNAVNNTLDNMIGEANEDASKLEFSNEIRMFDNTCCIVSFNYTSTFEYMNLDIPILHIHGYYQNGDNLIFGYKDSKNNYINRVGIEQDYFIDTQQQYIQDFYDGWRKRLNIKGLISFINRFIANIDEIVVLGHSLSNVDKAYFDELENIIQPDIWSIYFHGSEDKVLFNKDLYSFKNKTRFIEW